MDTVSEMENKNPTDGSGPKVKRKLKSAFQLEVLEKTYAGLLLVFTHSFCFVFNLLDRILFLSFS